MYPLIDVKNVDQKESTSKGKILFTGGNGFIGSEIIPLLSNEGWEVISPDSSQLRLDIGEDVDSFFDGQHYDAIIHAAIVGRKTYLSDDKLTFHKNMLMFESIFKHIDKTNLFINIDSGTSMGYSKSNQRPIPEDFGKIIPTEPYAFSKYCISKRVLDNPKGINLRIWGCFGPLEDSYRFFAGNINRYVHKKDIEIHIDRQMDFIYVNDLYKIIDWVLNAKDKSIAKNANCVYNMKYYLSEIADMINNLDDYKVNIINQNSGVSEPYCASPTNFPIKYDGLEIGIRNCFNYFKHLNHI
jgi:GDP-L-fucose synthase